MSKVHKLNTTKGVQAPLEFIGNGKKYILCDFENQWTLDQQITSKPLISNIIETLFSSDIDIDNNNMMKFFGNSLNIINDKELLALIWLNENETRFEVSTYKERVKEFGYLTTKEFEIAKEGLQSFFVSKLPSILKDTQIISALEALKSI